MISCCMRFDLFRYFGLINKIFVYSVSINVILKHITFMDQRLHNSRSNI